MNFFVSIVLTQPLEPLNFDLIQVNSDNLTIYILVPILQKISTYFMKPRTKVFDSQNYIDLVVVS